MKKLIILLPLFFIISNCFADQLALMSKEDAENTVYFLTMNNFSEVILWCACCDNDIKMKVHIDEVTYRQSPTAPEYYEVVIKGYSRQDKDINTPVDLAYVFIKRGSKAHCLGLEMGFQCDPCTKPFSWY